MRKAPGGGLPTLLPGRQNDVPVAAWELRQLLSWTLQEPAEPWQKETISELTVHRLTEPDPAKPDRPIERARCEVTLEAPIETVFALADNPQERAKWDDVVGQSMKKYWSKGHSFVSFRLEGLMGLAAEDFLLWDAQQAYDRNEVECDADANALWSYVILWQPAAVSWEGLPAHEGCFKPAAFGIGMVRHRLEPRSKTKCVAMARVQLSSSMLQYFLPSLMRSMLSSQSQNLLQRIRQLNTNADERQAVQELGVQGLRKTSSAGRISSSTAAKKPSADKVDAFLLDMPQVPPQRAAVDTKRTKVEQRSAASAEPPEPAKLAASPEPPQPAAPEAKPAASSAPPELPKPPEPAASIPEVQPASVETRPATDMFPTPEAEPPKSQNRSPLNRRKLEVPNGLQDEATELGVHMALGLGTLKPSLETGAKSGSAPARPGSDDESLRLRLGQMQSKWLQDVDVPKVQDPQINLEKEKEFKKLRGSDAWLLHLMREANADDFLPPPWRPKSGPGTAEAEELPQKFNSK